MKEGSMMTQRTLGGIGVAVAGLIGLLVAAQAAQAQVPYPKKALNYATWLARAMDPCTGGAPVSVVGGGSANGCPQANVLTDNDGVPPGATMSFARLVVRKTGNKNGRINLAGRGFNPGQRMQVQLKLRVTQVFSNTSSTFEDFTIACGPNPLTLCFTARLNGAVAGSISLADCLAQSGQPIGLANGNIEIRDSALLNCDTGKIIATPGILE
jgi:hypothetical protein